MPDVHAGVPPQVTREALPRATGGNLMTRWPTCPGCGGRMHPKRRRCTKCRVADERRQREAAA